MSSIFISYRRAGTSGYGGRLQEDLRQRFGKGRVFRDIDSIRPGSDFAQVIEQAVAQSGVVLVLIGSNWLNAKNENGDRRLDDPDDFVRLEIESALNQDIVVVPVLVEGALAPSPSALPPSISRLGRMQAIELSDMRWDYDVGRLISLLDDIIGPPGDEMLEVTASEAATSSTAVVGALAPPVPISMETGDTTTVTRVLRRRRPSAAFDIASAPPVGPPPAAAAPSRSGRNMRRLVAIAVATVVVLVVGVLASMQGSGSSEVTLPSVVGKDVAVATATLRKAGLVVRTKLQPSDSTPQGAVISQSPTSGTSVKKGRTVDLLAAGAAVTLPVPAVTTLDRAGAVAAIEGAGLVAEVVEQMNVGVPAGTVFLQSPEPKALVANGSTVTLTVSTGSAEPTPTTTRPRRETTVTTTRAPTPGPASATTQAGPAAPTTAGTPSTTPTTTTPLSTGNLVANPGAEGSAPSAPFTVGQAPAGWSRGAHQAIAAAYGASGQRANCFDAAYPSVGQLQGSGSQLFSGGYDASGGCGLPGGSVPTLSQVISLAAYAGRTDGAAWQASARLASWPGSGDGAELAIEVLGGSGQVLSSASTGVVSNSSRFAFETRSANGGLPSGAASVRLTLRFPVSSFYSGGFADDISFRFG